MERWEKGTKPYVVRTFCHSSSANPRKEQASFSKYSLPISGGGGGEEGLGLALCGLYVHLVDQSLWLGVGGTLETDNAIRTTWWADTKLSIFTVRGESRVGHTLLSWCFTSHNATSKGVGTYQTSLKVLGRRWVVYVAAMQTTENGIDSLGLRCPLVSLSLRFSFC